MATIRDVAKKAQVSISTVSAVINEKTWVSIDLRQRVEDAISQLNYRPNRIARALYTKKTQTLALLVPSLGNPFFARLLDTVESEAGRHGYSVIVGNTKGSIDRVQMHSERLLSMGVDGILTTLSYDVLASGLLDECLAYRTAVVGLGGLRTDPRLDCFMIDERKAGEQLANHLISLGHERIAFVGGTRGMTSALRYQGLTDALTKHGLAKNENLFITIHDHTSEAAYEAITESLRTKLDYTALVALDDTVAIEALNVFSDNDIRVPDCISLASFDNTRAAQTRPSLTTVEFPLDEMGRDAVERLLDRIKGMDSPCGVKLYLGTIVTGSSTAKRK